jgi:hypothetical protein
MNARRLIAMSVSVFSSVVFASFAYGMVLLWRGPSRSSEAAAGRPAALPPDVVSLTAGVTRRLSARVGRIGKGLSVDWDP